MPMTGIKCGDIGPKLGYNSKDNGYLSFDSVRIPRSQMLMKYVSVDKEGNYKTHGDKRVLYSIMLSTRVLMTKGAGWELLRGCLIGLRYSAVRRQF
jgi:acyl-CoA oxidase